MAKHVWIVHAKRSASDRSRETGWTPVLREYSESSANNLANLVSGNKKSAQIKISKHAITNGKTGSNAEWDPTPVSEKFIGKFSRSPRQVVAVARPKEAKLDLKGLTTEEKVQARRLHNMTVKAKPHARTARDRKQGI